MKARRLAIATALLLAGCSLAPVYKRTAAPVPAALPAQDSRTAVPSPPEIPGWERFFSDPDLKRLIASSLRNNRTLRAAIQRVEQARALYGIQRADQLPTISAGFLATRARVPAGLSVTGRSLIAEQYQATVNISTWELDFWGRVRDAKRAAQESYLAADEARRAAFVSLIAQIAHSYLQERELDELLAIGEQTLAARRDSYRIAKRRLDVGSASKLDAVGAESLVHQAEAELLALKRARELNRNALELLVGAPVTIDEQPLSAIETGFIAEIPAGLPSEILMSRPDVRAAEHRLIAANADLGAARAAYFPRIALTGAYGVASSDLDRLFKSGSRMWTYTPSVTVPIFTHGRLGANAELSRARREEAAAEYENAIQSAFREVADALAERRWLDEQVTAQRAVFEAQSERARLAKLRYESGATSYLELLDAERNRFAAEQSLVQTRRARLASGISLFAALGGGALDGAEELP